MSIWLKHKDYPNYLFSPQGNVLSLKTELPVFLVGKINKYGYHQLLLRVKNKRIYRNSHRIIAQIYVDNPKNLPQVNHKNGIKTDNRIENLEWCSHKENTIHRCRVLKKCIGSKQGSSKLKETDIPEIRRRLKLGHSLRGIGKDYGVGQTTIGRIKNGTHWKHVSQ